MPRLILLWLLALLPPLACAQAPFEDSMAQRMQACTLCHGKEGRAAPDGYYPRIAGKPAGYLYQQLLAFRDGRRHYGPMRELLAPLSDGYLQEIAQHFAQLELPYAAAQPATLPAQDLARGQALVRQGDASRGLPACSACHGEALLGAQPRVPGLLGLPRDYLNGQLGAWRAGQRRAAAPDCMAEIAKRLRPEEINAISHWLAGQTVPAGAKPAPAIASPAPMRCGGLLDGPVVAAVGAAPDRPANARQIEQGAYLARVGNCMGCHTQAGGQPYAGGRGIPTPFGTVFAPNLTPDPATGLGRWSAEDFWNALHHGRSKDGRLLSPAFPYDNYTLLSRADSDAIHAYLRSLPAVVAPARAHGLRFPYNTQAALWVWRTLYFRAGEYRPEPGRDPAWNRGAYLSQGLAHCSACHGPRNALGARPGPADFSGAPLPGMGWYAPSLHDKREAGVAGWTEAELMQWLKTGTAAPGSALGPMAEVVLGSTQHLSEPDLRAMARYLQSLPPQERPRPQGKAAEPALRAPGQRAYLDHCASCHGRDGEGRPGAYPALRGNRTVLMEPPTNLLRVMLQGGFAPATPGHPRPYGMPPFAGQLNERELAAIASYVRQAWGNQASAVQALQLLQHKATR